MKKRLMACLLTAAMLTSLFPLSALAADAEGLCPHHTAHTEDCGYAEEAEGQPCGYFCPICPVQDMIDALPEDITADNRAEVAVQLEAIGEAWAELSGEDALRFDAARLEAAWDALAALDGQAGNGLPTALAEGGGTDYLDENREVQLCEAYTTVTVDDTAWLDGWYVTKNLPELTILIAVYGDVHLILADNCSLTTKSGIILGEGSSLTIYA